MGTFPESEASREHKNESAAFPRKGDTDLVMLQRTGVGNTYAKLLVYPRLA